MLLLALCTAPLHAQEPMPPVVSYQGFLTTPAGAPLSGQFALTFSLYDVATGGAALWQETHPQVTITEGVFSVFLGETTRFLATPGVREFDHPYFLGVAIDGAAELIPRLALASLPVVASSKGSETVFNVDCGAGQSIGDAISQAPVGERMTVIISGSCTENLIIDRDWVTLDGQGSATLTGITPNSHPGNAVVYLDGARSIEINGLTITGPAGDATGMHGVHLDMISSARIAENSRIENHNGNGILVSARSQLDLLDATVTGNTRNGIYARNGSNANTRNAEVSNNTRSGIFLHRRSSGTFESTAIFGNGDEVTEWGFCKCALFLDEGSAARVLADNALTSSVANRNAGGAVWVYRGSSLRFAGGGTVVENTSFNPTSGAGVALDAEMESHVRASGDTVTIRGHVLIFNITLLELRNVLIEGFVNVGGLDAHFGLRDQSGVPGRVSLVGDIRLEGGTLSLETSDSQAARIDGNIDCRFRSLFLSNVAFEDPEDGYMSCPSIGTDVLFTIGESADPISVGGSVTYDVTAENIKRSPAVEALSVAVTFTVRSAGSFTITGADTAASPAQGTCNINDPGSFDGSEFVGGVSCQFDSVRVSSATAQITVSSVQADLNVDGGADVQTNGDDNTADNSAAETTTVQ